MRLLQAITASATKEGESLSSLFSRIGIVNTLPYKWSGQKSRISSENLRKICSAFADQANSIDVLCAYLRDEVERSGIPQEDIVIANALVKKEDPLLDPLFLQLRQHLLKDKQGKKEEMLKALLVLWSDC